MKATFSNVNSIMLLIVGLLAGFIGGYALSRNAAAPSAAAIDASTDNKTCPYELAPADRDILAGFKCPALSCSDPLLDCHCETAHRIKQTAKQLLSEGKSPEEVRAAVKTQYSL